MDEAPFVPNIEPSPDAWNIERVRMLDRLLVRIVFDDESVEHLATMINEMNAILSHPTLRLVGIANKVAAPCKITPVQNSRMLGRSGASQGAYCVAALTGQNPAA